MVWASDERQFNLRRQACWFVFRVDNVARAQSSTGWWKTAPVRFVSWWMLPGAGGTSSTQSAQSAWWYHDEKDCLSVNGTEMQFLTEYSDFRFVDGIFVLHKENKFAGNVNTAKLLLRQITFDAALDDD